MVKDFTVKIIIPQGTEVEVINNNIKLKKGSTQLERNFRNPRIVISKENDIISIACKEGLEMIQKDKMFINTIRAHIKNMLKGLDKNYVAKLKICSGHFPMNVSVEGNSITIKNFLGEKVPRKASIMENVKVQVQGDAITVTGPDKEKVGQTAARIEQATRITNRDRRIFQDGCFIISKPGDEDE